VGDEIRVDLFHGLKILVLLTVWNEDFVNLTTPFRKLPEKILSIELKDQGVGDQKGLLVDATMLKELSHLTEKTGFDKNFIASVAETDLNGFHISSTFPLLTGFSPNTQDFPTCTGTAFS
jgi:hypothetical protein